jgi:probable F420-dependent oxidoreductase
MATKPKGLGIWAATNTLDRDALARLAEAVESRGYDVLWYPESLSYESMALGGFLLARSSSLTLASGIANIYARDAVTAAQGHDTLNRLYGGRFVLGLGVSHVPLVEGARGHVYGKPVAAMRAYLEGMAAAKLDPTLRLDDRNVVLAALGPRMLALSRDLTKGALPYAATPEHTAQARAILGPDAWLCVEQKICLTTDRAAARKVAAVQMARYLALPNYRNNWLRLGFTEAELSNGGSPRFLDAMVASGSEAEVRGCIEAHVAAGADHVCLQPFRPDGGPGTDPAALDAFAPGR